MNFTRRWAFLLLLLPLLVYFAVRWLRRDGPSPPVVFSLFVLFAFMIAIGRPADRGNHQRLPSDVPVSTGMSWPKALRTGVFLAAVTFAGLFSATRWGLIDFHTGLSTNRLAAGLALQSCLSGLFVSVFLRVTRRPPRLDT